MSIVTIDEIRAAAGAQEVQISGWDGGEITVKLRRPALTDMARTGSIPNPLIGAVGKLFMAAPKEVAQLTEADTAKAMHAIAAAALVEPRLQDIEATGACLTDDQLLEIYTFAIGGAERLTRFRAALRGANRADGGDVQHAPEQPDRRD